MYILLIVDLLIHAESSDVLGDWHHSSESNLEIIFLQVKLASFVTVVVGYLCLLTLLAAIDEALR